MDFKSLIEKIESIDGKVTTPQAPKLPDPIKLDEDAEMRVLAGTSTVLNEAAIMEKKLTAAEKSKKEEIVKSMKKDKAGFKERYGKRGEEVMHATATKIAKKKAESTENSGKSLNEAPMDVNLIRAAQDGMSSVRRDAESDRNIDRPYGSRGADTDDETAQTSTATSDIDAARNKAEFVLSDKVRSADDIDVHIMPLVYRRHRDLPDDEFDQVAEKLIAMAQSEDLDDPSDKMFKAVGDAVVDPYKFLGIARPKKEDIESEKLRAKFLEMVESKKQESYTKKIKGKKAEEKMDEAKKSGKKKPDADGDGVPDWADEKPGQDDNAGKKSSGKKGMAAKQAKERMGQFAADKKKPKKAKESMSDSSLTEQDLKELAPLIPAIAAGARFVLPHLSKLGPMLGKAAQGAGQATAKTAGQVAKSGAEIAAKNAPAIGAGAGIYSVADEIGKAVPRGVDKVYTDVKTAVADLTAIVGKTLGEKSILNLAATAVKYSIPLAVILAVLYGGKKAIDSLFSNTSSKKVVAESVEQKLTFKEMMKLVVESGGQQQIDPLDKALFDWATRIAKNKLGEGMKAEVYAGMVYERMGGRFEMYDVLSEDQK